MRSLCNPWGAFSRPATQYNPLSLFIRVVGCWLDTSYTARSAEVWCHLWRKTKWRSFRKVRWSFFFFLTFCNVSFERMLEFRAPFWEFLYCSHDSAAFKLCIWTISRSFLLLLTCLDLEVLLYFPWLRWRQVSTGHFAAPRAAVTLRPPPPALSPSPHPRPYPKAWERNSGNIFPCEMPRSSRGVWRQCIVPAAKKGTACDEANSCWSQKNRHFLTPTSFLIGQHKTIPDQPAKRKRKKEKEWEQQRERWASVFSACAGCVSCSWKHSVFLNNLQKSPDCPIQRAFIYKDKRLQKNSLCSDVILVTNSKLVSS